MHFARRHVTTGFAFAPPFILNVLSQVVDAAASPLAIQMHANHAFSAALHNASSLQSLSILPQLSAAWSPL